MNTNGYKETEIGMIPDEWEVAALSEKYTLTRRPKGLKLEGFDSVPFVPMDLIPFSNYILKKPQEISSGTYFEEGDILLSKITPSFENGKQGIIPLLPNSFGIATTEVIPIKEIPGVSDKHFLFYYLLKSDVRSSLAGKMEGSTGRQRLSPTVIKNLRIPFPPLPEQRTIAAILSKIQQATETQEKIIERTKELKKALMAKLFTEGLRGEEVKETEIGMMPKSWEVVRLAKVADIVYGAQAAVAHSLDPKIGTPILTNINVTNEGQIDLSTLRYFRVPLYKRERLILKKGDILFNWRSGSREHVGKTAIFDLDGEYTFSSFILRFRAKDQITDRYLCYYLRRLKETGYFAQYRQQSSVNSVFNASVSAEIPVALPEPNEQKEIVDVIGSIQKKINVENAKKITLEKLFKSTLHELMTGKLRVKDLEMSHITNG